ncbi:MAG TPA: hypothetical protein DCF89_03735, partial [Flavobacteriales bacterium]|nr:hypothetical protein [Flavobacteriales bacterium]
LNTKCVFLIKKDNEMSRFIFTIIIVLTLAACGTEHEPTQITADSVKHSEEKSMLSEIAELHKDLLNNDGSANRIKANELYQLSLEYIEKFPDGKDRFAVMEYARASSTGAGNLRDSDRILKMLIDEFPNHELRPEKLSLRAFTLWQLGDIAGSTRIYKQIIEEYPNSEWAEDAQGSLQMNSLDMEGGQLPDYFEQPK